MKKKPLATWLLILILLQSILLTGCWSSKEVEKLAIVTVMGIDFAREKGSDVWTASARIMNPSATVKTEDRSGKVSQDKFLVGKGRTALEAVMAFTAHTSRAPYYGHIIGFIFGQEAAREKLVNFIDGVTRYNQTRPHNFIMVTKGTAQQVLESGAAVENLLSDELRGLAEHTAEAVGQSYGVGLSDFLTMLESPDKDAVATLINVVPTDLPDSSEQNLMEGLAIFRASKLVGWLNKDETRGYLLLTQKISVGQIPIPVKVGDKIITYTLNSSKSKIKSTVNGDKISYQVSIKTIGAVTETEGILLSADEIKEVESAINDRLSELAMMAVNKSKEYDSDFLGFSEKLHRTNLTAWNKLGPAWRDSFREADVEIVVDTKVIKTGNIGKELHIKQ